MNSLTYQHWQEVAAAFEIKPTIFEKWIHYGSELFIRFLRSPIRKMIPAVIPTPFNSF